MLFELLVLAFATASVTAVPVVPEVEVQEYPRFIEFPGGDGQMHSVDLEEEPDLDLIEAANDPTNNRYWLFTRRNPDVAQQLAYNDEESVFNSNFDASKEVVVISHGWLGGQNNNINPTIRDAYLNRDDVNVIVLDWRYLALGGYITAASGVPRVGRGLGLFLEFLNRLTGAPYDKMHLVGFSLGAHLVGNAGRFLDGQVARVTGLDPAGPLWRTSSNRISPSDARYVEAIHTNGGLDGLGIGISVGDVDFHPNGGSSQPGCITPICDHERAWKFFASTVTHDHLVGRRCSNFIQLNLNTCRGDRLNMGNSDLNKSGSGTYRVNTRWRYPY
ncbi:pancreatic triacylglycerol lipase-like [Pectinophora gossypiella]|uniref:pancreatic triacylglycerol lipase-like n=1 Tax=Pectinophora gossypiella TaxID=13191 RepID=UPI00214E2749|nr:pancreatic triacylglycerol lipase-like [Pectinophora gossypiella]